MIRNYLLRLSSHEPACLHTRLHILSKPVGPGYIYVASCSSLATCATIITDKYRGKKVLVAGRVFTEILYLKVTTIADRLQRNYCELSFEFYLAGHGELCSVSAEIPSYGI
jgi:hypothetical protein